MLNFTRREAEAVASVCVRVCVCDICNFCVFICVLHRWTEQMRVDGQHRAAR